MKKKLALCMSLVLALAFGGCSDYKGLSDLTVVAGIAVDMDQENPGGYLVTFEVVDATSASKEGEMQSKLLETRGNTITEAVYNANQKLHNNMYFGNAEMLVISHQLAEKEGLRPVVDPFLRDSEIRDNMYILISGEDTAGEIIEPHDTIVSFYLNKNLKANTFSANSTKPYELYEIYDIIEKGTISLSLPMIYLSDKEEKEIALDGTAIFEGPYMVGRLENDDVPYYLLAVSKLVGGSFDITTGLEDVKSERFFTLANRKSTPSLRYEFADGKFTFTVKIKMEMEAVELSEGWGTMNGQTLRQIEDLASGILSNKVKSVIRQVHLDHGIDIVGFAERIRNRQPTFWSEIEPDWPSYLESAEVVVDCKVLINDTGQLK